MPRRRIAAGTRRASRTRRTLRRAPRRRRRRGCPTAAAPAGVASAARAGARSPRSVRRRMRPDRPTTERSATQAPPCEAAAAWSACVLHDDEAACDERVDEGVHVDARALDRDRVLVGEPSRDVGGGAPLLDQLPDARADWIGCEDEAAVDVEED